MKEAKAKLKGLQCRIWRRRLHTYFKSVMKLKYRHTGFVSLLIKPSVFLILLIAKHYNIYPPLFSRVWKLKVELSW
jgi:hypothetical protein